MGAEARFKVKVPAKVEAARVLEGPTPVDAP